MQVVELLLGGLRAEKPSTCNLARTLLLECADDTEKKSSKIVDFFVSSIRGSRESPIRQQWAAILGEVPPLPPSFPTDACAAQPRARVSLPQVVPLLPAVLPALLPALLLAEEHEYVRTLFDNLLGAAPGAAKAAQSCQGGAQGWRGAGASAGAGERQGAGAARAGRAHARNGQRRPRRLPARGI